MEPSYPIQNAVTHGQQAIEFPGIKIDFLLGSTFVSSTLVLELEFRLYSAFFPGNKILASVLIDATPNKLHFKGLRFSTGDLEICKSGKVVDLMAPIFAAHKATFVATSSRRPAYAGAIFEVEGQFYRFLFHIQKGAINSPILATELQSSIRVTGD